MKKPLNRRAAPQRGAVLIEALVAFVVLAFGLLALAGFQTTLQLNSDLAKQRSEATRLAQERIEELRAFATLTPYAAYADVAATSVNGFTSNTTFNITQGITTSSDPDYKLAKVEVKWFDRTNTEQTVTLDSVIAGVDPKLSGRLRLSQWFAGTRRPKNRAISVPYPSKSLGNGTSVFKPVESGTKALVFSDATGMITSLCNVSATTATGSLTADNLTSGNCEAVSGYLVQGFIRYATSSANPSGSDPDEVAPLTGIGVTMTLTELAQPYSRSPAYECFSEPRKGVKFTIGTGNNSLTRQLDVAYSTPDPSSGSPYTDTSVSPSVSVTGWTVNDTYTTYSCVVFPANHDVDASTSPIWTGQVLINGISIGNDASQYAVCRYSFDYDNSNTASGAAGMLADSFYEHPETYTAVNVSLTDQNFLIVAGNKNCPSDSNEINPNANPPVYNNFNTIKIQP